VALAIAPLVLLVGMGETLLNRTIQNLGHVPLFALIATLLLALAAHWFGDRWGVQAQYLGAFAGALFVGVATEFIQMLGRRDADLSDLARNVVGATLALVWWCTFDSRLDTMPVRRRIGRVALRGIVVVVLLALLAPLVGVAAAYRERNNRVPVLYSFETPTQARFMKARLAWYQLIAAPDSWALDSPEWVARIVFRPLAGGALVLNEPYPDWTGHEALSFEFFVPGEREIEIGIRIDDRRHPVPFGQRFNRRVDLEPGFNSLRIPMEEIVADPIERDLDISSIRRIIVFPIDPVGGHEIYLRRVFLEPQTIVTSSKSPG
jgi:hypothetical protein